MKIHKIIPIVLAITIIGLIKVYLQTEIIKIGYQLKERQDQFQQLVDNNNVLKYNIFVLESPYTLGRKIFLTDAHINIIKPSQVVSISTTESKQLPQQQIPQQQNQIDLKHPILWAVKKFLTGSAAEAQPIK